MTQELIMEKSKGKKSLSLRSVLISTTLGHLGLF